MSFFPELDGRSADSLIGDFVSGATPTSIEASERPLYWDELAVAIAQSGEAGVKLLLEKFPTSNEHKRHAILLGLAFAPKSSVTKRRQAIRKLLASQLEHSTSRIVSQAIDTLSSLGFTDAAPLVLPLLRHRSPYVAGAVLRFLASHDPVRAKPLLLDALESSSSIIRQNAIDELDEMECAEALPRIRRKLKDTDPNVRLAAKTAVENLDSTLGRNGAKTIRSRPSRKVS